jgi:hypothetical protein
VGIGKQFFDITQHACAIRDTGEDKAVASQIEEAFEHAGSRSAAGKGMEFGDNGVGALE